MRTAITPSLTLAILPVFAQVSGGDMFFDAPEALHLDSIYPAGCWQVGHPNKPVFTSAYSEPNALVTDTVLPHMDSTTCYAQFTMVADLPDVLGKWISFRHWSDMDSVQSFGWIEKENSYTQAWSRLPISDAYYIWFEGGDALNTDSGVVFTGRTLGWHTVDLHIDCMGVLLEENEERGGGWSDTMRLRFAFRGAPNTNGRDGWMIDNVTAVPVQCSGSVSETGTRIGRIYPDPADDHLTIECDGEPVKGGLVELWRADGVWLQRQPWRGTRTMTLDTEDLPNGLYFVTVRSEGRSSAGRVIIQH